MDEPLKPPSQQPKRYFDIVPSKHALPPATSRPIVTNKTDNLADPMVVSTDNPPILRAQHKPDPIVSRHGSINVSLDESHEMEKAEPFVNSSLPADTSETMMAQEYQEIEHELPSGQTLVAPESSLGIKPSVSSETMMEQEYREIEHELPSGENFSKDKFTESSIKENNQTYDARPIRRRHNSRRKEYIWVLIAIAVLIIVADLLLDSGVWKPGHNLPHTNFWH